VCPKTTEKKRICSSLAIRMQDIIINIKMANKSYENLKFQYLGTTVTNQNLIYKDIKCTLNLEMLPYSSEAYLPIYLNM
jgi:hypothetical protein